MSEVETNLQKYIDELDNEIGALVTVLSHYDDVLPSDVYRELAGLKEQCADIVTRLKSILATSREKGE